MGASHCLQRLQAVLCCCWSFGNDIPYSDADLTDRIDQDAVARFRETERYDAIRDAVHHLPDKVRRVAVLYYLELWSIKEIHAELGLAIGTIKSKLRQTRELLRKGVRCRT